MMRRGLRGLLAALTVLGFLLIGGSASAATLLVFAGNGSGGFSGDGGPASSARLLQPRGIAADSFGNLYIADYGNKRVREVTTDGVIHTVGGTGVSAWNQENGTATSTNMQPMDVAVTDSGVIYVADYSNWRLREIDPYGNETLVAGPSATAGHSFNNIRSVAYDNLTGTIYVANSPYLYAVRQVGGSTSISIVAGNGSNCGTTPAPDGSTPTSVAVCPTYVAVANGIIYMAETDVNAVQKIDANGLLQTVAGTGAPGYTGDGGQGVHAKLWMPSGVAVDKQGDVYIADNANDAIREVDPSGVISTVATTSGADPQGVSVSPDGGGVC